MLENYLSILEDSLKKKNEILDCIREVSQVQTELLKSESLDMEAFDRCVDEKDIYIRELNEQDEGFEALYEKIRQELSQNKAGYADRIERLKKLITEVTDKSVSIQAQESRNKARIEQYFADQRRDLGKVRKSSRIAYGYYQNMSKVSQADPRYMDTKK